VGKGPKEKGWGSRMVNNNKLQGGFNNNAPLHIQVYAVGMGERKNGAVSLQLIFSD
jgi:hypothetical protein